MRWLPVWLILLLLPLVPVFAQENDTSVVVNYIPKYSWAVGAAYSSIPGAIDVEQYFPDNYEVQCWLADRWFVQAGVFLVSEKSDSGTLYAKGGFGLYAGGTLKLFLFKNAYLIPSLNLYYDQASSESDEKWALTLGPTLAFEYFLGNRISFTADIVNLSWGYVALEPTSQQPDDSDFRFLVHKALGMGIRYNFNLGKN